jgi:putative transposase
MGELTHYAHCVSENLYHLEWATKYRDDRFRSFFRRSLCEASIRQAASRHGIRVIALRVLVEHVHVFVELCPAMSPSRAVMLLKGYSSWLIRKHVRHLAEEKCLWSPGKFIRSVGSVTSETIEHYITMSSNNQLKVQQTLNQGF